MLDYAQCMRDHGIDMPDPQFSADGTGGRLTIQQEPTGSDVPGPQPGDAVFDEAESACRPLMEAALADVTVDPERQAEMREQMLDYAECMREHGVDVPDPVFSDNGMVTMQVAGPGVEPLGRGRVHRRQRRLLGRHDRDGGGRTPGHRGLTWLATADAWRPSGSWCSRSGWAPEASPTASASRPRPPRPTTRTTPRRRTRWPSDARTSCATTSSTEPSATARRHRSCSPAAAPSPGCPSSGQLVEPGDAIVDVDGRPVLTALGDVPMWRDLGPGVDDGADVAEVEHMLRPPRLRHRLRRHRRRGVDERHDPRRQGLPGRPRPGRRRHDLARRAAGRARDPCASTPSAACPGWRWPRRRSR